MDLDRDDFKLEHCNIVSSVFNNYWSRCTIALSNVRIQARIVHVEDGPEW